MGSTSGDHYALACKVVFDFILSIEQIKDGRNDTFWFSEAAAPNIATGKVAVIGFNEMETTCFEGFHIGLRCSVFIHMNIHSGCNHDRRCGGEKGGGE